MAKGCNFPIKVAKRRLAGRARQGAYQVSVVSQERRNPRQQQEGEMLTRNGRSGEKRAQEGRKPERKGSSGGKKDQEERQLGRKESSERKEAHKVRKLRVKLS